MAKAKKTRQIDIGDYVVQADEAFIADLRVALCHLHSRVAERIGTTGDMQQDTALGQQLNDLQLAHDQL